MEGQADVDARQLSGAKAKYLLNRADLKAARVVLRVASKEYDDAGLTLREFWSAIREEIESVANSFQLLDSQRRLLEIEFFAPPEQKASRSATAPAPSPSTPKRETVATQINRLREECHLTAEELAEKIGIEPRSVQRHLAGSSVPHGRHVRAYERVFSNLLNRQVVISKMS